MFDVKRKQAFFHGTATNPILAHTFSAATLSKNIEMSVAVPKHIAHLNRSAV